MDEVVVRAMAKWPSVPRVFGWLRLDRRGNWLVRGLPKTNAPDPAAAPVFQRIGNPAVIEFIGRNYEADGEGRWFFQNGPQRVFVALDYTPQVYRLGDDGSEFVTQGLAPAGRLRQMLFDDGGALLLLADPGIGLLDDRDLAAVLERLIAENPDVADLEAALEPGDGATSCALPAALRLSGQVISVARIRAGEVAARFAFNPDPRPPAGEPEC